MMKIFKGGKDKCPHCNERMIVGTKSDVSALGQHYDYCRDNKCNWVQFHLADKSKWLEVEE